MGVVSKHVVWIDRLCISCSLVPARLLIRNLDRLLKRDQAPKRPRVGTFKPEPNRAPGDRFRDCDGCPELVVLPPGRFQMGSSGAEPGRRDDESPKRWVAIGGTLAVGRYEVTIAEWQACVSAGACPPAETA